MGQEIHVLVCVDGLFIDRDLKAAITLPSFREAYPGAGVFHPS